MSQENVELVRRGFEDLMRTGHPPWDMIDQGVEVHDHDSPDQGTYDGHAGLLRWLGDWDSAWETWSIEPEEFRDAGHRVVAVLRMTVRGEGSGLELERQEGHVWTVRSGQAVRLNVYGSRAEALEAVGLRE